MSDGSDKSFELLSPLHKEDGVSAAIATQSSSLTASVTDNNPPPLSLPHCQSYCHGTTTAQGQTRTIGAGASLSKSSQTIDNVLNHSILSRTKAHQKFQICPCTQFGLNREIQYPHHFFCHECSLWEKGALALTLSRIKPTCR
ncbi:hypothetical protein ACA910_011776 [Epithemia clementina (nom. ined.)]